MPVRLTLDLYSGRPNPAIELGDREAGALLDRLRPGRALTRAQAAPPPILGYRGLIVEQSGRARRALPRVFRVVGGRVYGEGLAARAEDPAVEEELLGRADVLRRFGVPQLKPEALRRHMRRQFEILERWRPVRVFPRRQVCRCAPVYEPAWWNDGGPKQGGNNCYNYGCNYRTDTFAQPGRASGAMYSFPIDGPGVKNGAVHDDLEDSPSANNKCPGGGHLVALVIAPAPGFNDFHWYRKGLNGRWTHKPGGTPATNVDNSGAIITDPRTADRGPYTQFVTFMVVRYGHIKIKVTRRAGEPERCSTRGGPILSGR